jgi:hypothetical protein
MTDRFEQLVETLHLGLIFPPEQLNPRNIDGFSGLGNR